MIVGTDTYVTVAEAGTYIASHYRSTDQARTRWTGLPTEDKEILLVNACAELEQLPFHGRKAETGQLLSFPRFPLRFGAAPEVPAKVKAAQIELALWLSDDARQAEQVQRRELQMQGVTSFSIGKGDLSETYTTAQPRLGQSVLACPKAAALLAIYLQGGYETC